MRSYCTGMVLLSLLWELPGVALTQKLLDLVVGDVRIYFFQLPIYRDEGFTCSVHRLNNVAIADERHCCRQHEWAMYKAPCMTPAHACSAPSPYCPKALLGLGRQLVIPFHWHSATAVTQLSLLTMTSSHVVVFFLCAKNADIVSVSAVAGHITKDRWQGRAYRAKIMFLGTKPACEAAIKNVTEEGDLRESFFLVGDSGTPLDAHTNGDKDQPDSTTSNLLKELLAQVAQLSKTTATMLRDHRITTETSLARLERRLCRGELNFKYVSRERVESLLAPKCGKLNKFALALEKEVFADDTSEFRLKIEDRKNAAGRINFIREVIFKYFNVSTDSEESVWQTVKNALNGRRELYGVHDQATAKSRHWRHV
ncbi:hypothetical protein ANCDUO_23136 [Ancylostoma duodenale]|uniref:Uncharacterized protein n=1 Tax=Ancylostoma duodenale TaxID=51022 RepID=A0A0C2CAF3_9BILA|nr:hypothetical protein ANCDUO_23136 [Ancylostoma duodenale]